MNKNQEGQRAKSPPNPVTVAAGFLGAADPKRAAPVAELGVHVHQVSTETGLQSHNHDHDHRLQFDIWTYASDVPMQMGLVQQVLSRLPSTVFRVKGFVHRIEEPQSRFVLQLVDRRVTVTPTRYWGTEQPQTLLVFISRHDTVNFTAIEQVLNGCRVEV